MASEVKEDATEGSRVLKDSWNCRWLRKKYERYSREREDMSPGRGRMARCVRGVVGRPGGKGEELCGCPLNMC